MKFVHYISLTDDAKSALSQGDGKHGRFAVDGRHIAVLDETGRACDWVLVVGDDTATPIKEETS